MRIFLTGATGYIGSAVLDALARARHEVTCLVRTAERAGEVTSRGGTPVMGDLGEPDRLVELAAGHDGWIHAGFEASSRGPEADRAAIEALVTAARREVAAPATRPGADARFLVYTSGVWVLGNTREPAAEDAPLDPTPHVSWRPSHERVVLDAAGPGLRTIVVRPGIVCGGRRGIIGDLIRDADKGLVRIVGTGENRWPVVFLRDLADLYLRFVSRADASGVYHACDESDERVNDIASAIGAQMRTPPAVRRMPLEEAQAKMGNYALAIALDQVVRCPRAKELGWAPARRSVVTNASRLVEEWRASGG